MSTDPMTYWGGDIMHNRIWMSILGLGIVAYVDIFRDAYDDIDYCTVQIDSTRYPDKFNSIYGAKQFVEVTYALCAC